jgi:hypothetical protein
MLSPSGATSAELREQFEREIRLRVCAFQRIAGAVPRPLEGARAEHVGAGPAERMPIADRQPQMIFHPLAEHELVAIVVAIRKRIVRVRAFVAHGGQMVEIRHARLLVDMLRAHRSSIARLTPSCQPGVGRGNCEIRQRA